MEKFPANRWSEKKMQDIGEGQRKFPFTQVTSPLREVLSRISPTYHSNNKTDKYFSPREKKKKKKVICQTLIENWITK